MIYNTDTIAALDSITQIKPLVGFPKPNYDVSDRYAIVFSREDGDFVGILDYYPTPEAAIADLPSMDFDERPEFIADLTADPSNALRRIKQGVSSSEPVGIGEAYGV